MMSEPVDRSNIRCNNCHYEGKVHASGTKQFAIFFSMLLLSAFFLPLIIAALAYMIWILAQAPKRLCPQCKSTDLETLPPKAQDLE